MVQDGRPVARRVLGVLLALSAGCVTAPVSPAVPQDGREVRVLVFNIHAGKDAKGQNNLAAVADLATSVAADVVLLQEVDRGTKRSGNVDQVRALATRSGYASAFGRSLDYDGGQYGIAVLSR